MKTESLPTKREVVHVVMRDGVRLSAHVHRPDATGRFSAMQINRRYRMTQDTFQVQERFFRRNPAFTPWQPNGSGNGRMLDMMLDAIWFEHDETATLLGAVPFVWLTANEKTSLKNLHTEHVKIDIEIHRMDDRLCYVKLSADGPACLPRRLRIREHFTVTWNIPNVRNYGEGFCELPERVFNLDLIVSDNETT